jgi:2-polyprenyl-3-methyl-5-hydroxy-6-metoxy-1,4-benzoquinol methylase
MDLDNGNCPICESSEVYKRPQKLRDSDSISVLGCHSCDHGFLDSFDHIDDAYFERGQFLLNKDYIDGVEDRRRHYEYENQNRFERIGPLIINKNVLDFGCGVGSLMEKIKPLTKTVEGVEPTDPFREYVHSQGYTCHATINDAVGPYDFISTFHVLEHIPDPIAVLRDLSGKLSPNGLIYVEVPNVNDALVTLYDIEACHSFNFFKDHLHYFSRHSLDLAIAKAGLSAAGISGHNRFGLANHMYWLRHGKPGGHLEWSFLETPSLVQEYARALAAMDVSDSLVAQIRLTGK